MRRSKSKTIRGEGGKCEIASVNKNKHGHRLPRRRGQRKKMVGSGFHTRFPFVAFNAEGGDRAWNQV